MTKTGKHTLFALIFAAATPVAGLAVAQELPGNDYPTVARADYVYACMAVNGQTRDVLEKCSCSIDQIASLLPYTEYEEAETLLSVGLKGGENVAWTKIPQMQEKIKNMRRAQVEGELRCF
ncbi:conserved hypothetical protein [Hyphomicrobium sp. GJ21]|uniref:hypothetical protein n=1 Tax=Hyphomicrobium sp. GJ21 TaxID=113574 RepID=UPI000622B58B|nr:hypothetical protein [Hyphomicrobium sp. GJ21]CEJ85137.1 conserved hypothetical protein [Hyphomicrobium sp. GJ21]